MFEKETNQEIIGIEDLEVGSSLYEVNINPFFVNEYKIARGTKTRWVLKHPNTNFELQLQVNKHNLEKYGGIKRVVYSTFLSPEIKEKLAEKEMFTEFLKLKKAFDTSVDKAYTINDEMKEVYKILKKYKG